jgi:hypothetical protein
MVSLSMYVSRPVVIKVVPCAVRKWVASGHGTIAGQEWADRDRLKGYWIMKERESVLF